MVARLGSVVLVTAAASDEELAPILDHVQIVAANGGNGRQLVRGFALQLSTQSQDPPSFVAVAAIDRGLAVFAVGEGTVEVDGQQFSGRESLAWVEKVVPWPVNQVALYVADALPAGGASSLLDLRDGVIAAGGCTLSADAGAMAAAAVPTGAVAVEGKAASSDDQPELTPQDFGRHKAADQVQVDMAEPAVGAAPALPVQPAPPGPAEAPAAPAAPAEPAAPAQPAAPAAPAAPATPAAAGADEGLADAGPVPAPGPPVARRPAFTPEPAADEQFESILIGADSFEAESVPTPLPVIEKAGRSRVSVESAPVVKGVFCKNNHFNDPRMLFCGVCGINMVQQTPVLVDGARPPLGVLVLDDGAVFQLDSDYLVGRDPDTDERSQSSSWRAIPLADNQNAISRVHARIELRRWDVVLVDNDSTNGTFYADPKSSQWTPVPRGGEQVLQPGWRIRIGHRTLAFNTHRG